MKLDKKQLDALQQTIWHWYENLYLALAGMERDVDASGTACKLCHVYFPRLCLGCLVRMAVGGCRYSPWRRVWRLLHKKPVATKRSIVDAICAQIHFLESLDTGEGE